MVLNPRGLGDGRMNESQIVQLRADIAALEMVLTGVLSELVRANPDVEPVVLRGFDSAANACERLSIQMGERARHFTLALERLEEMRRAVKGHEEKRHGV